MTPRCTDRRGEVGLSQLLKIILVVLGFLVLLPIIIAIIKFVMFYGKGGTCLATAAATSMKFETLCYDTIDASGLNFKCPRRHVDVGQEQATLITDKGEKGHEVTVDGKAVAGYTFSPAVAQGVMADELLNCWERLGSGEIVLFQQGDPDWKIKPTSEFTVCHICSEIVFQNLTAAQKASLSKTNLSKYISENSPAGRKETYRKILNNPKTLCEKGFQESGATCWDSLEKWFTGEAGYWEKFANMLWGANHKRFSKLGQIDPEKGYFVVFIRKRFDNCQDNKQNHRDADLSNFVYILPDDELNKACDVIVT